MAAERLDRPAVLSPRRLAALDMHGRRGTARRRRIVLAEFLLAVLAGALLGVLVLTAASGAAGLILGLWLLGISANYLPLAGHALAFIRPGALERELRDVEVEAELRSYTRRQLWLAVPFAVAGLELRERIGGGLRRR